jgi:hypothetical protein
MGDMTGFHYEDIFATKGIEYILVVLFLVAFIFFIRAIMSDGVKAKKMHRRH